MPSEQSPVFNDAFSNHNEIERPVQCKVTGRLPSWLNGTLLRNGPGTFKIGDNEVNHWFDGLAYIRRYYFENGKMFYSAKHLRSKAFKLNHAANRIVVGEFGTAAFPDPCKTMFQRFFSHFEQKTFTDNGLVNFVQCSDRVYAVTETPAMNEVDVETLDTKEKINLAKYVTVNTVTAHHHYDSQGNIYNVGSTFGSSGEYVFVRTDNTKEGDFKATTKIGSIPMNSVLNPSYYHSFGMTEDYIVFFECPLRMNVPKLLASTVTGSSFLDTMHWDPSLPTHIHVINKKTGDPLQIKIRSKAFFTFHHANAYQKGDYLIVDYCKTENGNVVREFTMENMRIGQITTTKKDMWAMLQRMVIPLNIPKKADNEKNLLEGVPFAKGCKAFFKSDGCLWIEDVPLCNIPVELPRYNYSLNTKPYKYCYGAVFQHPDITGILKVNVDTKTHVVWRNDNDKQLCGEPVFVADPYGADEDDGVLLCPLIAASKNEDPAILVLDAKTMKEVARCHLPALIPLGFHGLYMAQNGLSAKF
ncbi:hypothetical protein QR680_016422 [Steinernema hermaphroditum]|uniref:Uncharacterized protein n=1 Tax=Steinernema hermaphroditum TaxID=289476 RepID=A0AA39HB60_9BILA|nr:hypothetical protein QR680_016422 [Steinernema hermaphroditum]